MVESEQIYRDRANVAVGRRISRTPAAAAAHRALLPLLLPQSLALKPLALELSLLLGELRLGLCLLRFPVLHGTADGKASNPAQRTTDCRARARRAYCRTDYRARRRA
jgi:hypothetical protein